MTKECVDCEERISKYLDAIGTLRTANGDLKMGTRIIFGIGTVLELALGRFFVALIKQPLEAGIGLFGGLGTMTAGWWVMVSFVATVGIGAMVVMVVLFRGRRRDLAEAKNRLLNEIRSVGEVCCDDHLRELPVDLKQGLI